MSPENTSSPLEDIEMHSNISRCLEKTSAIRQVQDMKLEYGFSHTVCIHMFDCATFYITQGLFLPRETSFDIMLVIHLLQPTSM